jgi:selenocysteine lyase/cysteine desulfurase
MEKMGVQGMVRASIASYNRGRDVEKLLEGLERIMKMKGKRK